MVRRLTLAPILILALLLTSCGGNFTTELRLTLALAPPLIDSLVDTGAIPASTRTGLITDFVDLSNGAANLVDDIKACGASKTCKLEAVRKYYALFTIVAARGHFGANERLLKIERLIQGVLDAALIYYGGAALGRAAIVTSPEQAKQKIDDGLKELRAEMKKR